MPSAFWKARIIMSRKSAPLSAMTIRCISAGSSKSKRVFHQLITGNCCRSIHETKKGHKNPRIGFLCPFSAFVHVLIFHHRFFPYHYPIIFVRFRMDSTIFTQSDFRLLPHFLIVPFCAYFVSCSSWYFLFAADTIKTQRNRYSASNTGKEHSHDYKKTFSQH